jgi:hypothetical protein
MRYKVATEWLWIPIFKCIWINGHVVSYDHCNVICLCKLRNLCMYVFSLCALSERPERLELAAVVLWQNNNIRTDPPFYYHINSRTTALISIYIGHSVYEFDKHIRQLLDV